MSTSTELLKKQRTYSQVDACANVLTAEVMCGFSSQTSDKHVGDGRDANETTPTLQLLVDSSVKKAEVRKRNKSNKNGKTEEDSVFECLC